MGRCFLPRSAPPTPSPAFRTGTGPHPQDQRFMISLIICIKCGNLVPGILSQLSRSTTPESSQECSREARTISPSSNHCLALVAQNASWHFLGAEPWQPGAWSISDVVVTEPTAGGLVGGGACSLRESVERESQRLETPRIAARPARRCFRQRVLLRWCQYRQSILLFFF